MVIREEELAETGRTIIYHFDGMSIIRIAPSLAKQSRLPDGYDRCSGSITVDKLQRLVEEKYRIEVKSTLLDWYLEQKDFKFFTAGSDFTTRRLYAENDNSYLLSLYEACTEDDLDKAAIDIDEPDPVIYGIFAEKQLVAYASHRYWDDVIADIGVLVHPRYWGRSLGKMVVSALCKWCFENEIVPMYRVFSDNTNSIKLSQALGFKELVIVESLNVERNTAYR